MLTLKSTESAAHYLAAEALLRRSLAADPWNIDAQTALAYTLADLAIVHFVRGALAESRATSLHALEVIQRHDLSPSAKTIETWAFCAVLEAFQTGQTGEAKKKMVSLLLRSIESGWCSTATRLAGYIVGLHSTCGEYIEAIGWYERISRLPFHGMRPRERSILAFEAAHAFTMAGRPKKALSILREVEADGSCHRSESPTWHASVSAALERSGFDAPALAQAQAALASHTAQLGTRGVAEAHRLIAVCNAKLGNPNVAKEHIIEAQRLSESHGTPYALLRTLVATADIFGNATVRKEAIELAHLLQTLGKRPSPE